MIDIDRIHSCLEFNPIRYYNNQKYILGRSNEELGCLNSQLIPYIPTETEEHQKNYCFVTIGRLSPEKNHLALIEGFSRLLKEHSTCYLYIIGDGPLKSQVKRKIQDLQLENRVILTGNIDNPFSVMQYCDCFILPSLHEGQPMVVNEARVMKMPIIISDFSSSNGILIENGQLVIGTDTEEIYNGMKAFIEGNVPYPYDFDPVKYNREAYQEFLHTIGE